MRILTSSPRNTGSESTPSDPPPASSWATPPEFYLDENAVTRTVQRLLLDLGYVCHTPPELFGTRAQSEGVDDTAWLQKIAGTGWVVLNRDAKIMQRPDELAAYRAARVHMFYLPGEARRDHLKRLIETHLRDVVTYATNRKPEVWKITDHGVQRFPQPASRTRARRR